MRREPYARGLRAAQEARVIKGRVKAGEVGHHGAPVVALGAQFTMLLGLRHHGELDAEMPGLRLELAREPLVMRRRGGGDEPPAHGKAALDPLLADRGGDRLERGLQLAIDADRPIKPDGLDQHGETMFQRAADITRVPAARALAEGASLEHQHAASGPRERKGSIEARDARPDDRHLAALGQRVGPLLRRARGLPPIGLEVERGAFDRFHVCMMRELTADAETERMSHDLAVPDDAN